MYLHEKLLDICKNTEIKSGQDVNKLNRLICEECEKYYKSRLSHGMTKKSMKAVLDKTFNLFDLFVKLALKSDDAQLVVLAETFKKYSFKKQFLENKQVANIYNSL